jgi:hypothetical protein
VDDKHIPLFRVVWVSAIPHFCGSEECQHEGDYEILLEGGEVVWANRTERDAMLKAIEDWQGDPGLDDEADLDPE